jgi:hypothetical protein
VTRRNTSISACMHQLTNCIGLLHLWAGVLNWAV